MPSDPEVVQVIFETANKLRYEADLYHTVDVTDVKVLVRNVHEMLERRKRMGIVRRVDKRDTDWNLQQELADLVSNILGQIRMTHSVDLKTVRDLAHKALDLAHRYRTIKMAGARKVDAHALNSFKRHWPNERSWEDV